ncbi:fungal-specific transcription factor domain-containing protein [Aspergillus granulosus]|uniref:Fungal-specific transcription factor domain-containing protein n=1 Tax=Aspergillus granulosus TaxID=176169 RepID=A0ABR4H468_9EURO
MESSPAGTQRWRIAHLASGKRLGSTRGKYVARACHECRRRRAKCNGGKPSCSRCLDREIDCVYTNAEDQRGTAPKSLVHLLQSRINVLEQILRLHSIDIDASIAELTASGVLPSDGRHGAPTDLDLEHMCAEFDGALCLDGLVAVDNEEARFFGLSSGRPELLETTNEDGSVVPPTSTLPLERYHTNLDSQLIGIQENNISDELVDHLIGLYFKWEQPWHQVVDERLFRESMQTNGRYSSQILLNAILSIGSRYSDRIQTRSNPDESNTAGQLFLEAAEELLHFELKSPSITTIQALAVMAVAYVAMGSDDAGWLRHGMAIRLALDMGFNLDPSILKQSYRLTDEEAALRRQIYWALYCTDKLWASYTGRICTVLDSQALVTLPTALPPAGGPVTSTAHDGGLVVALTRALSIHCLTLEKILMNLYAPKKLRPGLSRKSFFDSCLLELRQWKSRLPGELNIDLSKGQNNFPHAYTLTMVYYTSVILLVKPFLPNISDSALESSTPTSQNDGLAEQAAALCLEATRKIYILGEQYREAFGSFRQSPITATHCTLSAALVSLRLRHGNGYKADRRHIDSYLKTLHELSDAWMPAKRYWRSLACMVGGGQNQERTNTNIKTPLSLGLDARTVAPEAVNINMSQEDAHIFPQPLETSSSKIPDGFSNVMVDENLEFDRPFFIQDDLMFDCHFWYDNPTDYPDISLLDEEFNRMHNQP